MQTNIAKEFKGQPEVVAAEEILRKCVHCGFCLATCPTYNIIGDELDSPRGRIYQIKQVLEGTAVDAGTQLHLDRCLTCRNCETTCPSGVEYGRLLDIGRQVVEQRVDRPLGQRLVRKLVQQVLPYPSRIGPLVKLGQLIKPVLPSKIAASIPHRFELAEASGVDGNRTIVSTEAGASRPRMLLLDGCVQPSMAPLTNSVAISVLNRLGIEVVSGQSVCCGAIDHHLNDVERARDFARSNIDTWWAEIEAGAEAVLITASGCGSMVKDYGHLFENDPVYSEKAKKIVALTKDISEVLLSMGAEAICSNALNGKLNISKVKEAVELKRRELKYHKRSEDSQDSLVAEKPQQLRVAFHPPCSLQHGQKLSGQIESLLAELGFTLTEFDDAQECCGSAGTYSIFQPKISSTLKAKKIANLHKSSPDVIATANIGCQLHLQSVTDTPVIHWIELLGAALPARVDTVDAKAGVEVGATSTDI